MLSLPWDLLQFCHSELGSESCCSATSACLDKSKMLKQVQHDIKNTNLSPRPLGERGRERGCKSRAAFTLAEVLITLGIIGVVAALTIPGVISKIRFRQYKAQTLRAMSTITQGMRMYVNEYGAPAACGYLIPSSAFTCAQYTSNGMYCAKWVRTDNGEVVTAATLSDQTECSALWNFLKTNLKVAQICDSNAYEQGCMPYYKGFDEVIKEQSPDKSQEDSNKAMVGCSSWRGENLRKNVPAIVLIDGTVIFPFADFASSVLYAVDVNGKKGPNKWGYDVQKLEFYISGVSQFPSLNPSDRCIPPEKGGVSTSDLLKNY